MIVKIGNSLVAEGEKVIVCIRSFTSPPVFIGKCLVFIVLITLL